MQSLDQTAASVDPLSTPVLTDTKGNPASNIATEVNAVIKASDLGSDTSDEENSTPDSPLSNRSISPILEEPLPVPLPRFTIDSMENPDASLTSFPLSSSDQLPTLPSDSNTSTIKDKHQEKEKETEEEREITEETQSKPFERVEEEAAFLASEMANLGLKVKDFALNEVEAPTQAAVQNTTTQALAPPVQAAVQTQELEQAAVQDTTQAPVPIPAPVQAPAQAPKKSESPEEIKKREAEFAKDKSLFLHSLGATTLFAITFFASMAAFAFVISGSWIGVAIAVIVGSATGIGGGIWLKKIMANK